MVAGKIWSGNGYQRENQTNIGWAGNRLTDSGKSENSEYVGNLIIGSGTSLPISLAMSSLDAKAAM